MPSTPVGALSAGRVSFRVVGPDRNTHLRNFAILILIAVAVWQLPGGGTATATINNLLGLVFAGGLVFFGYRMYMEHRPSLFMLEDKVRALLYGSVVLDRVRADRDAAACGTRAAWACSSGSR